MIGWWGSLISPVIEAGRTDGGGPLGPSSLSLTNPFGAGQPCPFLSITTALSIPLLIFLSFP